MRFRALLVERYSRIWAPATLIATAFVVCDFVVVVTTLRSYMAAWFFMIVLASSIGRTRHAICWFTGAYFLRYNYYNLLITFTIIEIINIASFITTYALWRIVLPPALNISAMYTLVLCLFEIYLRDDFREHMQGLRGPSVHPQLIHTGIGALMIHIAQSPPRPKLSRTSRFHLIGYRYPCGRSSHEENALVSTHGTIPLRFHRPNSPSRRWRSPRNGRGCGGSDTGGMGHPCGVDAGCPALVAAVDRLAYKQGTSGKTSLGKLPPIF
ncbi:hypothetical protein FB451DRAFT_1258993 [Mycena latifolia]|nr:hypothetical protein FB451DRAFT_1258993 [Mycena latifolia]